MAIYMLELQQPPGVLVKRSHHRSHKQAMHVMRIMVKQCIAAPGLVLVFKDRREITYAALRGTEVKDTP